MVKFIKTYILDILLLTLILIPTAYLRLADLGYSDYIGDEQKAFIRLNEGENLFDFFMKQRKGPFQFVFTFLPYLLIGTYTNEAAIRLPFALLSVASVGVFYLLLCKLTKSRCAAFFSAAIFASNGFSVGFGRIAQYQNLNLVFSFLSIYFAYNLTQHAQRFKVSALLSVFFFVLSFLSHWDAVFILPVLAIYFLVFLRRADLDKQLKLRVFINALLLCSLVLLPFMIPYVYSQLHSVENATYFNRRIGVGIINVTYFKFLYELYNPFVSFTFISFFALLGAARIKKSWVYVIWFVLTLLAFWGFFRKPGTHMYNFVIPAIVLAGLGIELLVKIFPKPIRFLPVGILSTVIAFLFYQSYVFFVEHTREYPWQQKSLYVFSENYVAPKSGIGKYAYTFLTQKTPQYTADQKLPLFGFPHNRYWNEINAFIDAQNKENNEKYGYHTNEDKAVSEWYMKTKFTDKNGFYGVGINRPTNFVPDWSYTQSGKSRLMVKEFGEDEVLVRIYKITPKPVNSAQ